MKSSQAPKNHISQARIVVGMQVGRTLVSEERNPRRNLDNRYPETTKGEQL
jgi:hypothetical protein